MNHIVIVAGAGAAGLTAAICAARNGARVMVLERMDKPAKKILATGNGRCNYTNENMDVSYYRGGNPEFIRAVISHFDTKEVINFFRELGIEPKCRDGYYYPYSMQAASVAATLLSECRHLNIEIACGEHITAIYKEHKRFKVKTSKRTLEADAVILAVGGCASPKLGSDGSGYAIARKLGLHVTKVVPALTGLKCQGKFWKSIAGVRIHASVSLYNTKLQRQLATDTGEIQLTSYGISGIPVFQVSRFAAYALDKEHSIVAVLDFMPDFEIKVLYQMLKKRFLTMPYKTAEECLAGLVPAKMIPLFLQTAGIEKTISAKKVLMEKVESLAKCMKQFEVTVIATNSFDEAQVCAGGVDTREVNPQTMMSYKIPGLYITGELLDVDGMCGGYNLHFAWATGITAGTYAAKGVINDPH